VQRLLQVVVFPPAVGPTITITICILIVYYILKQMDFKRIYPHIICICKTKDEKQESVEIMGTGLYLAINGKNYLLTAGHVMDAPRGILIMAGNGKQIVSPFKGGNITTGEDEKIYDLGIAELGDEYLPDGKIPYSFEQMIEDVYCKPGKVLLVGFPVDLSIARNWGERSIEASAIDYTENEAYVNYAVYAQYDSVTHIAIEWNPGLIEGNDVVVPVKPGTKGPKGLSGAPMWVVDDKGMLRIVGIVISNYSLRGKEYIIGVRTKLVNHFIKTSLNI